MKKRLIKKEWEAHIQDFKESGLSKAAWCQKQNLPVHWLYYWLKKLSPQADSPTESKRTKWVSMFEHLNWANQCILETIEMMWKRYVIIVS
jgi:hypothetical protein